MQPNGEINSETVKRIADLSRLRFTDSEIEAFAEEFSGMEPMSHVLDLPNVFREDVPSESLSVKQALENAPSNNETFFKVPKVME
jgi:Asp-tRNA(Asn)/Glu-tRNA(Gln) amidotransferase C subunit